MILIIDNYDSFTYNLYQYVGEMAEVAVKRNDKVTIEEIKKMNPSGIIISPGPGRPENAGIIVDVIKRFYKEIPILGICLGHQAIGYAFKGNIVYAKEIKHGKISEIQIKGKDIFDGVRRRIKVMRYHSLIIDKVNFPLELEIIGESLDTKEIMAIKHKEEKLYGLQFHPESIGTEKGMRIIENFIKEVCNEYM
ncbi:MAG: anthranilate synthase component II [Clostridium sp.]|uniref:anthranilate synthase component II n=1 Tax=Clostridium sp. TaxID=1506 RepID=UPI003F2A7AA2